MSEPDEPPPRYRYVYIALTILLIVGAVALIFKLYNMWE
jgi:hypothetical protein